MSRPRAANPLVHLSSRVSPQVKAALEGYSEESGWAVGKVIEHLCRQAGLLDTPNQVPGIVDHGTQSGYLTGVVYPQDRYPTEAETAREQAFLDSGRDTFGGIRLPDHVHTFNMNGQCALCGLINIGQTELIAAHDCTYDTNHRCTICGHPPF